MLRTVSRIIALAVLACALAWTAAAEQDGGGVSLTDQGLDLGTASVHWPQLTGMADAEQQHTLNLQIRDLCGAQSFTARVGAVMNQDPPLTVSWEGTVSGEVMSCALRAEGPLTSDRIRSEWRTVNLDLRTGVPFEMDALFTDPGEAAAWIEAYLDREVLPEMSAHLMNCDLLPLPENFRIGSEGLTLCYPAEQLSTLSDRAGAVTISWGELRALLDLSEDSRFRGVFLMTDALSEKRFDGSVLGGIRCDRFGCAGLVTGQTTLDEVADMFGEPYASVVLDAETAEAMRLPEGTSVYYRCGDYRLRLHFDSGDTLNSLFLLP